MIRPLRTATLILMCFSVFVFVSACGGGGGSDKNGEYTIGGTVTGLLGDGLVLQNNNGDDLTIASGAMSFAFANSIEDGGSYSVTVKTNPHNLNQTCTVSGDTGTGTVAGDNVTSVSVVCSTETYTIGGTITGLLGDGLVLKNNNGDDLTIASGAMSFAFANSIEDGGSYSVTVKTNPHNLNQTCTVSGGTGTGTVAGDNVTSVSVVCSTETYTIGGMLRGLEGLNNYVILVNNGTDVLELYGNETFTFADPVADGAGYKVEVSKHPSNPIHQTCTVESGTGTGTVPGGNVTTVSVVCSTNSYTIGGTANGVTSDVVLQNNGDDDLTIASGETSFTFSTPVADTAGYDVTVLSSLGLGCALSNSSGTVSGADVADVALDCTPVSATVEALFNTSGADWNDYVLNDGGDGTVFTATDTACDPDLGLEGYDTCLHGGEMRAVEVPGLGSCTGLTATDGLGAFDWTCDESTFPVRMVSTGLKEGKNLSDLLDFTPLPGWKDNWVTVMDGVDEHFTTAPDKWWSNPVVEDNDGGYLDGEGTIYVVTNDDLATSGTGYIINSSSVGLVAPPGQIINGPGAGAGSYVISVDGSPAEPKCFLWLEGLSVDASGDDRGIHIYRAMFSVLRDISVNNANADLYSVGVFLDACLNNKLARITASNNTGMGAFLGSGYSTFSDIEASHNGSHGIGLDILNGASHSTYTDVTASHNGGQGIFLSQVRQSAFTNVTASDNADDGVYFASTLKNTFADVTASNNGGSGVRVEFSPDNTFSRVTATNNGNDGINVTGSSNNTLSQVTASNNLGTGVYIGGGSDSTTLSAATTTNNFNNGVYVGAFVTNSTLSAVDATNNRSYGVYLYAPLYITLHGTASTDNGSYGLRLFNAEYGYFTGPLKVGNNSPEDCEVNTDGTNPGLVDVTCTETGLYGSNTYGFGNISDATLYNGVSLAASFMGKVYNDEKNSSATGSAVSYPADPASFDWSDFQNPFRGWGKNGGFDASSRGRWWFIGLGAIWDWSLDLGDTFVKEALNLPTGNDTLTHTWSDASETTFLRNAVEVQGDGLGNENTLCESGETCLYTPNIGSYQGHGDLTDAGYIGFGDAIEDVILKQYETNGYLSGI